MLDFFKNNFLFTNKYRTHSEAVIISCYFNPQKSPYRSKAFKIFYDSIKHLNHRIIECVIGDAIPELPETEFIRRIYSDSTLWHKETLLNNIICKLPEKFKYVFWVDADVIFDNLNWMVDGVKELQTYNILQPFELCVHLEKDQLRPDFDMAEYKYRYLPNEDNPKVWRSFCNNYACTELWKDEKYNWHGHVGFAWGAKRSVLDRCLLYDKALIGGADHIMAHAAAGQINHACITKAFADDIERINLWSEQFAFVIDEKISYVHGNLFHIWHGDLDKRQYLKRIQNFTKKTKTINKKDINGLYIADEDSSNHVKKYFKEREVPPEPVSKGDDGFLTSMAIGYATDDGMIGGMIGGNAFGGMIGDMLNDSDQQTNTPEFSGFGGGSMGGGGAGGEWGDDIPSDTSSTNDSSSENFS